MSWAKDFYTKQLSWTGLADRFAERSLHDHDPWAERRVTAVERLAGTGPKRILELGGGGGFTAAALAERGNTVVAVEIVEQALASIRRLAHDVKGGTLTAVAGDFYAIELDGTFDVVCYFDGFGIGSDDDQRSLLRRISGWLHPDGCALIDVLTPWYWASIAGREEDWPSGTVRDRFEFDHDGSRMVDRMWRVDDESDAVTQTIRCYSPTDLRLLLKGTGLAFDGMEPYSSETYEQAASLEDAMLYLARLIPDRP